MLRAGLSPEAAWLGATGLGAVDEGYQLLFLQAGRPDRFDWNDVAFNALGAALGVAILLHYHLTRLRPVRYSWMTIVAILVPFIVLALVTSPPTLSPFYSVTPAGLRSRELTAGEGLILLGGVWISVNALVRRLADRAASVGGLEHAVAGGRR
jgi:hypothetical protein